VTDRSFQLEGGRTGVLLIHGLTGAPAEVRFIARKLNRQGYTVHAPHLAGHGGQAELLTTTWRDWYASVRTAYLKLRESVDTVFAAGVCVGGALALKLAAEFPEIGGVAVYSMTFEYDGWNMARWCRWAPAIQLVANLPLIRAVSFAEPYPFGLKNERLRERVAKSQGEVIEGALDRFPFAALFQMYRLGRHVERIGERVRAPVLVLHAVEDDMAHPRNAQRLARCLGGSVEVQMIDDSYHMIHVDKQRDEVAALTTGFFQGAEILAGDMRAA
jgi:carboxylesterase